eukprot:9156400-Alexandrium_andersonii.AAC.1
MHVGPPAACRSTQPAMERGPSTQDPSRDRLRSPTAIAGTLPNCKGMLARLHAALASSQRTTPK